jgi:hypothetical protein
MPVPRKPIPDAHYTLRGPPGLSAYRLIALAITTAALCAVSFAMVATAQASTATAARAMAVRAASPAAPQAIMALHLRCSLRGVVKAPSPIKNTSTVRCSTTMPRITLTVSLYRDGKRVKAKTFTRSRTKFVKGSVTVRCAVGTYRGRAVAKINTPKGFVPRVLTILAKSKLIRITRC